MIQQRRLWSALIVFCLAGLSGCIDGATDAGTLSAPAAITADPATGLSLDQDRLFLHSEGDATWMDTDATATDTSLTSRTGPQNGGVTYTFDLTPTPDVDIPFDGAARLNLAIDEGQFHVGPSAVVHAALWVGGEQVDEGEYRNGLELALPNVLPAGYELRLTLHVDTSTTILADTRIMTNGESWLSLPLAWPAAEAPDVAVAKPGDVSFAQGEVNVEEDNNGRWIATRTDVYLAHLGSVSTADVAFKTVNGAVSLRGDSDQYRLAAQFSARADSEAAARRDLDTLSLRHDFSATSNHLELDVEGIFGKRSGDGDSRMISMVASLPRDIALGDAKLRTTNGAVVMDGFSADSLQISATNGAVAVAHARVTDLVAGTTNGAISVDLDAPTQSGTYKVSGQNGGISVSLANDAANGYDVRGRTTNGAVEFNLSDTEPVGQQSRTSKHERSSNFDARDVQTEIVISTTNGGIEAQS